MILLAQIENVPAPFLKYVALTAMATIFVCAAIVGIWHKIRNKGRVQITPSPLSVTKTPKRFNHDLAEGRHSEVVRRLDSHDAEIEQIWTTFRAEDSAIRRENAETMKTIMLALGRIQGRLGIEPKDQV